MGIGIGFGALAWNLIQLLTLESGFRILLSWDFLVPFEISITLLGMTLLFVMFYDYIIRLARES